MNTKPAVVANMKRISVSLEAGTSPAAMDLSKNPFSLQFVYGVGTEGFCLFEKALFEKRPGETILLKVDPHETNEVFGHLRQPLADFLTFSGPFVLKATVMAIETPTDRELVRAIAGGSSSSGCGCGCGC